MLRREDVTHGFLVPTMLARIVDVMDHDPDARVPSMRRITYGGARMPRSMLERALALFPDVGFVNAYGLTETSSTVCLLGPDDHRNAFESSDPAIRRRLESAGRPLPGIELRINGAGGVAAPGEPGEILVRGEQVSGEYLADRSKRDDAGWLHTGDLGFVDDDGYLFVVGRADDMIIRGGENLSPTEIEDVLLQHPGVGAAAVVGVPDAEWGERVAAMIVPATHARPVDGRPASLRTRAPRLARRRPRSSRPARSFPPPPPARSCTAPSVPTWKSAPVLKRNTAEEQSEGGLAPDFDPEFSPAGVRVNTVAAGPVYSDGASPDRIEQLGNTTLIGRGARVEEIADVIAFVASDKASYLTGAVIPVDGGRTAI